MAALGAQAAAQSLGPFGSEFRPTNPDQLFVSNAHNAGAGTGPVSASQDSAAGILSPGISRFAAGRPPRAGWRSPSMAGSCSP
jgi:hypothetical protein